MARWECSDCVTKDSQSCTVELPDHIARPEFCPWMGAACNWERKEE